MLQLDKYAKKVRDAQASWAPQVQYYKRSRRAKGVEKVGVLMTQRINAVHMEAANFVDVPRKFAQFKSTSAHSLPQLDEGKASTPEFLKTFKTIVFYTKNVFVGKPWCWLIWAEVERSLMLRLV